MQTSEFTDYSTILMDLEHLIKKLEYKCLHKKHDGYISDIAQAQSKLVDLMVWMTKEQK